MGSMGYRGTTDAPDVLDLDIGLLLSGVFNLSISYSVTLSNIALLLFGKQPPLPS
jgi:hypothetical protein